MANEAVVIQTPKLITWYKQKTTWALISTMISGLGAYFAGEIGLTGFIAIIIKVWFGASGGLAGIFMRQGVEKSKLPVAELPPSQRGDGNIVG